MNLIREGVDFERLQKSKKRNQLKPQETKVVEKENNDFDVWIEDVIQKFMNEQETSVTNPLKRNVINNPQGDDGEELFWSTLFTESGKKIDKIMQIDSLYFVNTDLPGVGGLTLGLSKPIIKKEFLSKHKIEYLDNIRLGQDFWFYLECLARGGKFFIIPEAYYFYRSRFGALTGKSKIERYEQYCEASEFFLQQDFIHSHHELSKAVNNRLKKLTKIRPYFQVIDSIKKGDLWRIIIDMWQNPYFFIHAIYLLPKKLTQRYNLTLKK
jgi:succinoglycan biosynthesis protein ExoO